MRRLHVAAAQINARVEDPEGNLRRMLRQIRAAACCGVEALLFAETCIHAYDVSPGNLALAEPVDGPLVRQVQAWAAEYRMTLLAGMLERDGDMCCNSHIVAWPDGALAVQRKHLLTDRELAAGLTPGPRERTVFLLNGIRCALLICADAGIPDVAALLRAQGIEYQFCPAGGGHIPPVGQRELDTPEGMARYAETRRLAYFPGAVAPDDVFPGAGFTAANALGDDGRGVVHMGHCTIVDNRRIVRAQIPGTNVPEHQQEQLIHAILSF